MSATTINPHEAAHFGALAADYCTALLPAGAGSVRYYIEAEDARGNVSRSALERIFLA